MNAFAKADRRKPRLTAREIEAMTWTARGKTGGEVATIMNIKEDTVRAHVENVRQKLEASNKTHAVALALAQKLIAPEPIWTSGETNTPFPGIDVNAAKNLHSARSRQMVSKFDLREPTITKKDRNNAKR